MEPDPLLSDLSAEERLEVWMFLLDEKEAREPDARTEGVAVTWGGPDGARVYLHHLGQRLEITTETIRSLADEMQVDLAPLVQRARDLNRRNDDFAGESS